MSTEYFSVARIIKQVRAARILELPLSFMGDEQFARQCSELEQREILGPMPRCDIPARKSPVPSGMPSYLASMYEAPLLTREQEAHLFRKMNYLKYLARKLRETLDLDRPKLRLMDRIEKLYEESVSIKKQIIRANLRLVVSIAKRYVGPAEEFFDLVSDGNIALIRAAEKFDVSRGNRFSTYASWAIMKNFARTLSVALRQRDRFCTSHSEIFSTVEDARANQHEQESAQLARESEVQGMLKRLDTRERQIIEDRFGLARGQDPQTFKQIGVTMGITKERVRQLQIRTLGKLRKAAEEV
jgi:RNA polymerase primary sigma factor